MTQLSVPETVSFEEAIALTQELLSQIEAGQLSETDIQTAIASLVKSQNGARGFFVTYLTDNRQLADKPTPAVFGALETAPETVPELLVKNTAMSSAMAVHHRRNGDEEMAASSERVRSRNIHLIQNLNLPALKTTAQELYHSATTGEGVYKDFLERWGYDEEQRKAISQALEPLVS
jgi:hypothetical protein